MASDLQDLRGVGPRLESSLKQLGINRVQDLLFHLPFRYEDRTRLTPIGGLLPGVSAQIEGEVAVLKLADPGSPTLVQDKDSKGALYVLMPMRV